MSERLIRILSQELSIRNPPRRTIPLVPPSVVPVSRNDISNKFWAMVEPYCAEITTDDIKVRNIWDVISSNSTLHNCYPLVSSWKT